MTRRSSLTVAVLVPALFATTVVDRAAAQTDADSLAVLTDQVFTHLDKLDSPGCTCAVMRHGEIVYSGAFGMANLELDVPLTPQSVFNVASVSKQFTAASIALLALRGQLSLDDDIRTYVPEMPDLGDTITIRHLIHHSSGIREGGQLRSLAGLRGPYVSNARLLALLSLQRTPNFQPGEEYRYSNTGYVVLAEIVKRVSGTSLREFARENIFGPLGMANTQVGDDYRTIVKHRVASYRPRPQGGLRRYVKTDDVVGPTSLLTTAEDLLRWNRNFNDMTVGGPDFIELILTRGFLNDGDTTYYAFGLGHREYRGLKTIGHNGSSRGFRTTLLRFPEQRFSVAVLCNGSARTNAGQLTFRVADIYLRGVVEPELSEDEARPVPEAVSVSTGELQKVTGHYWDDESNFPVQIYVRDDALSFIRGLPGLENKLVPLGNDRFYMLDTPNEVIVGFTSPTPGQPRQMTVVVNDGEPLVFDAVELPSRAELEGYLGTYYSEELDYRHVLRITNDSLSMWDPRTWDEFALTPVARDVFQDGRFTFTFSRDSQGRVVGFTADRPSLRRLQFVRR